MSSIHVYICFSVPSPQIHVIQVHVGMVELAVVQVIMASSVSVLMVGLAPIATLIVSIILA